jgi:hypothetical protein
LETGFNGEKLRETLIAYGVDPDNLYTERHIYRIVAEYKRELETLKPDLRNEAANILRVVSKFNPDLILPTFNHLADSVVPA